jgi:hypothetical protein
LFVPRIEVRGETVVAAERGWLQSRVPIEPPILTSTPPTSRTSSNGRSCAGRHPELADDLVELSGDVQPDVLARESIEFVGSAAAEPR